MIRFIKTHLTYEPLFVGSDALHSSPYASRVASHLTMARSCFAAVAALAFAAAVVITDAAVHPYNNEYFYSVGDAFIFRGGREGLFESKSEVRP